MRDMKTISDEKPKSIPLGFKFLFGGMAGMGATCIVQPFDVIKTRMQMAGSGAAAEQFKNSFDCAQQIVRKQGPRGLYKGIGAGLLRQATYTTGRMGVYTYLNSLYLQSYSTNPKFYTSMGMGMIAGAVGAFVGTPAEVVLIRMSSDGRLPVAERRNYTNVVNALVRITREEGLFALWRGCIPTMARAIVINMTQLASYTQFKLYFRDTMKVPEGIVLHLYASMLSGLITTLASMPLDIAKTRIQSMKIIDGKPEYRGTMDVLGRILRNEGFFALWKGFTAYYCRVGPHTVFTFLFMEQLAHAYSKYVLGIDGKSSGL